MSLKCFHVLFITMSVALTVLVAVWATQNAHWLLAMLALAGGAALVVYRGVFLRKAGALGLK